MKVLIACEYSGIVRDAFSILGHDAWSCDLLPTEKPGQHYQGDVRDILSDGWDLMIAHPDCTYLTCSAEWAYKDAPYHQKLKPETLTGADRRAAREDALEFVRLLLRADIKRIAVENPKGAISRAIRKPDQYINPHEFGHDASKLTGLWLKGLPTLKPTKFVMPRMVCCGATVHNFDKHGCPDCCGDKVARPRWSNQTNSGQNNLSPGVDRWRDRARTYQGIADAMSEQWGKLLPS
jgi:hypothetical protein